MPIVLPKDEDAAKGWGLAHRILFSCELAFDGPEPMLEFVSNILEPVSNARPGGDERHAQRQQHSFLGILEGTAIIPDVNG